MIKTEKKIKKKKKEFLKNDHLYEQLLKYLIYWLSFYEHLKVNIVVNITPGCWFELKIHITGIITHSEAFSFFLFFFLDFNVKHWLKIVKKTILLLYFIYAYRTVFLSFYLKRHMLCKSSIFIGIYSIFKKFTCTFQDI